MKGLESGAADRDGDGLISLDELHDYLYEQVPVESPQQTPTKGGFVEGRLYIAQNPFPRLPNDVEGAIRSPLASVKSQAVSRLVELLSAATSKRIADLALTALLILAEDRSNRVANTAGIALTQLVQSFPADHVLAQNPRLLEFVEQFQKRGSTIAAASDLETLEVLIEASHSLRTGGSLEAALQMALEATLRVTSADRGFIFLEDADGDLRLAAGRNARGEEIADDSGVSHSLLRNAFTGRLVSSAAVSKLAANLGRDYQVTEWFPDDDPAATNFNRVICIPLRKGHQQVEESGDEEVKNRGVFYLAFSRYSFSDTPSNELLDAVAKGVTALFEPSDKAIVEAQNATQLYRHELSIASSIQQGLSRFKLPDLDFAEVVAVAHPCREVGGDFFDAVKTEEGLAVVLADVAGKGVSAALLASTLQGLIHGQLLSNVPLLQIVTVVNRFIVERDLGKYATLIILSLQPDGNLELVNCGHVCPILVSGESVTRIEEGNLVLGLISEAQFQSTRLQLRIGDRLLLVTDGITEAEDRSGDYFGDERLENSSRLGLAGVERALESFRGDARLIDDTSIVELTMLSQTSGGATRSPAPR